MFSNVGHLMVAGLALRFLESNRNRGRAKLDAELVKGKPRQTNHGHGLSGYRCLPGAAEDPRFYKIELGKPCTGKAISQECSEAFRKNDDETATGCH